MSALARELPAGLDRLLTRLLADACDGAALAARIAEIVECAAPPPPPTLEGTPRLVLVAALALATRCPVEES